MITLPASAASFGFFCNFCFYFVSFFCFWACCWHFCLLVLPQTEQPPCQNNFHALSRMKYAKLCNDTRFRYPDAWLILAVCKITPSEVLRACKSKINHCPIVIHSGYSDHSVECWSWFQSSHSFLIPFASAGLFPFPFAGPFAGPFPGPFAGPLAAGACHSNFNRPTKNRISRIPSDKHHKGTFVSTAGANWNMPFLAIHVLCKSCSTNW